MTRAAVVGASGFVGRAVRQALQSAGHEVVAVRAPRVRLPDADPTCLLAEAARRTDLTAQLANALRGCDVVVNAAGDPDASCLDAARLNGANALVPALVARAAHAAGVDRLVHVSSAVVQADRDRLDDAPAGQGFSPYSVSKVAGEAVLDSAGPGPAVVVLYRPPSVHGVDRRVSRATARIARSPLGSVAGRGERPSPQALIDNVASAVAFLATCPQQPPRRVAHPWEGLTTGDVMRLLGSGREPVHLPGGCARAVVAALRLAGRAVPTLAAHARRVEILWFGQAQAPSWLDTAGWIAPRGRQGWEALASDLAAPALPDLPVPPAPPVRSGPPAPPAPPVPPAPPMPGSPQVPAAPPATQQVG